MNNLHNLSGLPMGVGGQPQQRPAFNMQQFQNQLGPAANQPRDTSWQAGVSREQRDAFISRL